MQRATRRGRSRCQMVHMTAHGERKHNLPSRHACPEVCAGWEASSLRKIRCLTNDQQRPIPVPCGKITMPKRTLTGSNSPKQQQQCRKCDLDVTLTVARTMSPANTLYPTYNGSPTLIYIKSPASIRNRVKYMSPTSRDRPTGQPLFKKSSKVVGRPEDT
ncbi:unnamed protein product [Pleuronectes platessa]|uniref:Uncharacterized protein n=1 Tax=Pleuronectes platessa TaxID=8262 RepID=A0A9N7TIL6_PLEPL|nr:unnamed protein product [Pleuronectes platessa]